MSTRAILLHPATLFSAGATLALLTFVACGSADESTIDVGSSPGASGGTGGDNGTGGGILGGGEAGGLNLAGGGNPEPNLEPQGIKFQYLCGTVQGFRDSRLGTEDVCKAFTDAKPAAGAPTPTLTYPLTGAMVPPNLPSMGVHWTLGGGATADRYRIDVTAADGTAYQFFYGCAGGVCNFDLPGNEWRWLGWKYLGQKVKVTVNALLAEGLSTSAPVELEFAPENLRGALYYWSANGLSSYGNQFNKVGGLIMRTAVGSEKAVPFIEPSSLPEDPAYGAFVESPTNAYQCSSCHSVSRDGKVIAFALVGKNPSDTGEAFVNNAAIQIAPTTAPTKPWVKPTKGISAYDGTTPNQPSDPNQLGMNVALSPEGGFALVSGVSVKSGGNWPPYLEVRDSKTGKSVVKYELDHAVFGANRVGLFPEFSPDGRQVAVTLGDVTGDPVFKDPATGEEQGCVWPAGTCRAGIAVLDFSSGALSNQRILVDHDPATKEYHFYPTWSEDGKWIAFMSATFDPAAREDGRIVNSQKVTDAVLRIVRSSAVGVKCPSKDCIELAKGLSLSGKSGTWPKFTPFAMANRRFNFLSFTSQRNYGNINKGADQLWMFAVDMEALGRGEDGSYPPFWLPYQKVEDDNLTPYWSQILPCETSGGGCSGCTAQEKCVVNSATNECRCEATSIIK